MAKSLKPVKKSIYTAFAAIGENLREASAVVAESTAGEVGPRKAADRLAEHATTGNSHHDAMVKLIDATFVTPFDRNDIHLLSTRLDEVLDHLEGAMSLADLTGVSAKAGVPEGFAELGRIVGACGAATGDAMKALKDLKKMGPFGATVLGLQREGHHARRQLIATVLGGDHEVLVALRIQAVVDELGLAIDAFADVARTVESIVIKES